LLIKKKCNQWCQLKIGGVDLLSWNVFLLRSQAWFLLVSISVDWSIQNFVLTLNVIPYKWTMGWTSRISRSLSRIPSFKKIDSSLVHHIISVFVLFYWGNVVYLLENSSKCLWEHIKEPNIVKLIWNLCGQPFKSVKKKKSIQNLLVLFP